MNKIYLILLLIAYCLVCFDVEVFSQEEINWQEAEWISYKSDVRDTKYSERSSKRFDEPVALKRRVFPSPLFRREFLIHNSVKSAKAYVCALGIYELYLNGEHIGDEVLNPAPTTFSKRAFYAEYDVSDQLKKGNNAIGLMLGSGFYGQNFAFKGQLLYGTPKVKLILEIQFKNGADLSIFTNDEWKATQSPILFDNIYAGETYDARKEIPGWNRAHFNDEKWEVVSVEDVDVPKIVKQPIEPMRKVRKIKPVAIWSAKNDGWILDMGQNITGWLQIKMKELRGTEITMQFVENLMPSKDEIDPASTGVYVTSASQTDIYICKGGTESWEPRFTYHGFRYVRIDGLSSKPKLSDFDAWLIRNDVERIGNFECSNKLIAKYYDVSIRTLEDNMQGNLTDCPHRERCAWLGDIHVGAEFASCNFNMKQFWRKTVEDFQTVLGKDIPTPGSKIPRDLRAPANIASGRRLCYQAQPDWGAATVLIPWFSYLYYGDLHLVKQYWPMMCDWMDFQEEHALVDYIVEEGFGDWCPPGSNSMIDTPVALSSTALFYQSSCVMSKLAIALHDKALSGEYALQAARVKEAFNSRFFNSKKNNYGSQTGTVMALHLGLVPESMEQQVAESLVKLIMDDSNGRYSTGIFGHRPLYTVLNDFGYDTIVSHLWNLTDYPSLGFMTEKHGLTTWPEVQLNWDESKPYPRSSFNHPMHAGFAISFHESLGGIRPDPEQPGFKNIILKPCFLDGVKWVKTMHKSSFGMIRSKWNKDKDRIIWEVNIPKDCTATIQLPAYKDSVIKRNGEKLATTDFQLSAGVWIIEI